ncbi:MAG: protein kinase [Candidatus Limnocylindria bacterium]
MARRTLSDRYELGERVGGGGMAEVYLARDLRLSRDVAIKVLHAQYAHDDAFVERFRREARSAASLHDPHVVDVYDAGSDGESHFLVMEYVPGGTLKDGLRIEGRYPEREALDISAQIAAALEAAHARGLVHRDLKPQNVLFESGGNAKVTDFGIAKAVGDQLTQTSSILGSPHYFSPEQAHGRVVDERSDLYSLGVVLYELLTGRPPFEGDSPVEIAVRHVHEEPVPPRRLVPELGPATEAVVLKAMAKDPLRRFQTAHEMKLAILAARDAVGEKAAAAPIAGPAGDRAASPLPGYALRGARSRNAAPLIVALLALALLLAGGAFALARRPAVDAPVALPSVPPSLTAPAAPTSAPTRTPTAAPATSSPPATVAPTLVPTAAPATSAPTTPAPAAPTAAQVVVRPGTTATPAGSVTAFYQFAAQRAYDRAAELWTARMRAQYPPATYINGRFDATTAIDVRRADVIALDDARGTATVAVDLIEATTSGTVHWTGAWQLVRVGSAWLLDQPNLAGG